MKFLYLVPLAALLETSSVIASPAPQVSPDPPPKRLITEWILDPPTEEEPKPWPTCRFTIQGEILSIKRYRGPECACECLGSACLGLNVSS
jgi:hypothetical protein